MDDVTRIDSAAKAAWNSNVGLARRGTPHGLLRRALRGFIHFFSYHLILSRQNIRVSYAGGFRLTVRPTVFHPKFFISSEKFAEFIDTLDLHGKRVAEIGTGTGILALAAARANGLGDRVTGVCTNLMSAIAPRPLFDVILSSPPKHAGEPKNLADRGWHAGPAYRDVIALFDQARERLKPDGRIYVMVSSDTDLDLFGKMIDKAGFSAREVREYSLVVESLIIYELLPR